MSEHLVKKPALWPLAYVRSLLHIVGDLSQDYLLSTYSNHYLCVRTWLFSLRTQAAGRT